MKKQGKNTSQVEILVQYMEYNFSVLKCIQVLNLNRQGEKRPIGGKL
jgi:hypothetical protein